MLSFEPPLSSIEDDLQFASKGNTAGWLQHLNVWLRCQQSRLAERLEHNTSSLTLFVYLQRRHVLVSVSMVSPPLAEGNLPRRGKHVFKTHCSSKTMSSVPSLCLRVKY